MNVNVNISRKFIDQDLDTICILKVGIDDLLAANKINYS